MLQENVRMQEVDSMDGHPHRSRAALTLADVGGEDAGVDHGHGADLHGGAVKVAQVGEQRLRACIGPCKVT